jgi:hypothetical protein
MEPPPVSQRSSTAGSLTNRARLERMSEPWALNGTFAIAFILVVAVCFGSWIGSGQFENLMIFAVWIAASLIIVFVRDYWWAPPLVLTTVGIGSTAFGFPLDGMEIGVLILAITFPIKIAMKTLRKAEPETSPSFFYWALLGFVVTHCVVIMFYNRIQGAVLKNIEKSYYFALAPLILYGLLVRYCQVRTIRPVTRVLYFTGLFVVSISIVVMVKGMSIDPFPDFGITFGWLDADGAMAILRLSTTYLVTASLAYWPVVRPGRGRVLLAAAIVIGVIGAVVSGGRLTIVLCLAAGAFFAAIRGKLWIALPFGLLTIILSLVLSSSPDLMNSLPGLAQRALTPLNFSEQGAQMKEDLSGSDEWHSMLRSRSLDYWMADTNSFWFGHGYKPWDYTMPTDNPGAGAEFDHMVELAIEMGATENMFSAITNIFGMTGLILYICFLSHLAWTLFKGARVCPLGSDARALCEFSLVMLLGSLILCPFAGSVPNLNLMFWQLGILAARPYLVGKLAPAAIEVVPAPEIPAFARPAFAQQTALAPHRNRPPRRA